MIFRTLQSTALMCLSMLFIQCGPAKSKNKQTEQEQTQAPPKEEYIVKKDAVKDIDGNSYNSVVINDREWLTSNLKVTRLNDGTELVFVNDAGSLEEKLWDKNYSYINYDSSLVAQYGLYYNYETVETKKLCPTGWHVASKEDWVKGIIQYTRDRVEDAYPEKELRSKTGWHYHDMNGNNKYKLNILPSGIRDEKGKIVDFTKAAGFWTSTNDGNGNRACMFNSGGGVGIRVLDGRCGQAVRCVKNQGEQEVLKDDF